MTAEASKYETEPPASPPREIFHEANDLRKAQSGEPAAQHALYCSFRIRVYGLTVRLVGLNDADDVTQQIWLQIFRNLSRFHATSSLRTWIFRLTVNECLQFRRRVGRRPRVSLEIDPVDQKPLVQDESADREAIQVALDRLEPELRAIFVLREIEKLSYAEIAAALKIAEGTVASRLSRARMELRQHLNALGWEQSP